MTDPEPPWLAHRRTLFMRHDAHRYLRQDHECFLPPGAGYQEPAYFKARREREALAEAKAAQAQAEAGERAFRNELAALRLEFLLLKAAMQARCRWRAKAGFDPSQPRVPAGNPDGGQWTEAGGNPVDGRLSGGINDPRILSDAGPDDAVRPGARFAQRRGRSASARFPEATPAQQVRLTVLEAQAASARDEVQRIDPSWRDAGSLTDPRSIEGAIGAARAEYRAAQERLELFGRLELGSRGPRAGISNSLEETIYPSGRQVGLRIPGASSDIVTVGPAEFRQMRDQLMVGAIPVPTPSRYQGLWFDRPDGTRFGLRWSRDSGATIDIIRSSSPRVRKDTKVHQR